MNKLSNKNVHIAGFGMDCFSVSAPKDVDIGELTDFLMKTNVSRREHIEFSYTYEDYRGNSDIRYYVFKEKGDWNE